MNIAIFTQFLLALLSIIFGLFIVGFLIYGLMKGIQMEKENRLRKRRRYF